jgi:hypothetical protein
LEEADKINEWDKMIRHEIKSHVQTITRSDLCQKIKKPQQVRVLFLPLPFPVHLDDPIIPISLPMVEIMHVDNINVLNAVILPIFNGTVPFTSVEHVDKQHLDMHHEHVMDGSMIMEFMAITT